MSAQLDRSTLEYLGEDYQYKLVKEFMEDKSCFKDLEPIIDQNAFSGQYLRMYVGTMIEYFKKHNSVPSYSSMAVELRQKAHTQADIEICDGIIDKIRSTKSDGADQTKEVATRFFRQQNFIKAGNEIVRLAMTGDLDNTERCEQLMRDAINVGIHNDYEESRLFDDIDQTLSEDFRTVIPTGIDKIDETLNGGLGKGELGVILGPSSFGKTSMTTSMALAAATCKTQQNGNRGFKVLQIVFEDRIKQIQRKHISKITQTEACNLSKEEYIDTVKEILNNYSDKEMVQENLRIVRLPSGEKSIEFIINNIIKKKIDNGFRPDLVIIDYFECIKISGSSTLSKWDRESLIMRKIESAANELNIAFWIPVQGNKESISTDLVTMDNGGGSIGKIQIAHIIMSITRSMEDISNNIATIAILKNRAGSSGEVIRDVTFNNGTCTISTENSTDGNVVNFKNPVDMDKATMELASAIRKEISKK